MERTTVQTIDLVNCRWGEYISVYQQQGGQPRGVEYKLHLSCVLHCVFSIAIALYNAKKTMCCRLFARGLNDDALLKWMCAISQRKSEKYVILQRLAHFSNSKSLLHARTAVGAATSLFILFTTKSKKALSTVQSTDIMTLIGYACGGAHQWEQSHKRETFYACVWRSTNELDCMVCSKSSLS